MKKILLIVTMLALLLSFSACAREIQPVQKAPKEIIVSAAASLKDALSEIQSICEKEKNLKLTFNFASSGTLQKQIEEGAPVDVFISAGVKQMDALENSSLIDKDSRSSLLKNKLVMIVPKEYKDTIKTAVDLVDNDVKISIGEPESVPAGQYAKESLTYLGLWDKLISKIVYAKDVRQVVTYVENGEAAAGIVYSSDAAVIKNSFVAQGLDEKSHKPIVYPAAIVSASKEKEASRAFLEYLQAEAAKQIFEKYGFEVNIEKQF